MINNFIEFLNEQGTYIAIRLDTDSQAKIKEYQLQNNIKDPIAGKDLHVTIVYSKKTMDKFILNPSEIPYIATISKFDNYNDSLVGVLDCPDLEIKHIDLLHRYNGTHDFDSYSPHISLSYNFQGDTNKLPPFQGNLKLVNEYKESLE